MIYIINFHDITQFNWHLKTDQTVQHFNQVVQHLNQAVQHFDMQSDLIL